MLKMDHPQSEFDNTKYFACRLTGDARFEFYKLSEIRVERVVPKFYLVPNQVLMHTTRVAALVARIARAKGSDLVRASRDSRESTYNLS